MPAESLRHQYTAVGNNMIQEQYLYLSTVSLARVYRRSARRFVSFDSRWLIGFLTSTMKTVTDSSIYYLRAESLYLCIICMYASTAVQVVYVFVSTIFLVLYAGQPGGL